MNTMATAGKTLFGTLALSLACIFVFSAGNASAAERGDHGRDGRDGHDHGGFNIGIGFGGNHGSYWGGYREGEGRYGFAPRVWSDGYYETVCQHVLVAPAHTERRWVDPIYQQNNHGGSICVHEGYWQDVFVPARYEDRQLRVWHPGYCRDATNY